MLKQPVLASSSSASADPGLAQLRALLQPPRPSSEEATISTPAAGSARSAALRRLNDLDPETPIRYEIENEESPWPHNHPAEERNRQEAKCSRMLRGFTPTAAACAADIQ